MTVVLTHLYLPSMSKMQMPILGLSGWNMRGVSWVNMSLLVEVQCMIMQTSLNYRGMLKAHVFFLLRAEQTFMQQKLSPSQV